MHLCCGFSLWRQMAPQQSAKFRTAFFGQFPSSLRNDSDANYASIWTLFSTSIAGPDVLCFRDPSVGVVRKIRKITVEILQSVKNRTQSLRKILRMVIINITVSHGSAYTVIRATQQFNGKWQFWGVRTS